MNDAAEEMRQMDEFAELLWSRWQGRLLVKRDGLATTVRVECSPTDLRQLCEWIFEERGFGLATVVVEETSTGFQLTYVFYGDAKPRLVFVEIRIGAGETPPSLVELPRGPSIDWHEREAEDLFGLRFEGHPRLGEFVLHEDWPDDVNPMRRSFNARARTRDRATDAAWRPPRALLEPGSFAMPIGTSAMPGRFETRRICLTWVAESPRLNLPRFYFAVRPMTCSRCGVTAFRPRSSRCLAAKRRRRCFAAIRNAAATFSLRRRSRRKIPHLRCRPTSRSLRAGPIKRLT